MMVHLNKNFEVIDKDKKIIWSILLPFFVLNVAALIATSWYSNDIAVSVFFRRGMSSAVVRWVGAFTISDGYNALVSYTVPLGLLILESLFVYLKKKQMPHTFKVIITVVFWLIYAVVFAVFEYYTLTSINHFLMQDRRNGFNIMPSGSRAPFKWSGDHFVFWFWVSGWEYYSIFLVSIIINNVVAISLLAYIHFVVAKRKDFIESKYWLKAIEGLVFVGFLYLVYGKISVNLQRPHPYRVKWTEFLNEMQNVDHGRYKQYYLNYINPDKPAGLFNWGWFTNVDSPDKHLNNQGDWGRGSDFPGDWPWWKDASKYRAHYAYDGDFPSGHMCELCIALNSVMIIFGGNKQSKKQRTIKMTLFAIIMLWWLDMIFSMLVMQGHWLSDMAFSFVWALPAYYLSWLGTKGVFIWIPESTWFKKGWNKTWLTVAKVSKAMVKKD